MMYNMGRRACTLIRLIGQICSGLCIFCSLWGRGGEEQEMRAQEKKMGSGWVKNNTHCASYYCEEALSEWNHPFLWVMGALTLMDRFKLSI